MLTLDMVRRAKDLLDLSAVKDPPPFAPTLSGRLGRYRGMDVMLSADLARPADPEGRSRYDIEATRAAMLRLPRRKRRQLERKLRRMEDKFAQRALLGWGWLAEHPDHPLHIPQFLDLPSFLTRGYFGHSRMDLAVNPIFQISSSP